MYIFIYHIFFIHSSVNGPLGNFHVLTFVNISVMNIRVCVPFQIRVFFRHMPREAGFLGHMAILISGFFFFLRNLHTVLHSINILFGGRGTKSSKSWV